MLNFAAWIVTGGLLGVLASRWLPGNSAPGTMLNSLAGAVGAFAGGLIVRSALAALDPATTPLSVWALAAALGSGLLLVAVVNVPARGRRAALKAVETEQPPS